MDDLAAGLLTGLALIVAIGAQNAFVLRQGLTRRHVLPVVAVCALSDAVLVTAGVAGLGSLVTAHPVALDVARFGGAAFLLGYAVVAARRALRPGALTPTTGGAGTRRVAVGTALALTWLNPHVYLDTVVLLGSVSATRGDGRWWFGAGAVVASLLWFVALGLGARLVAPVLRRPGAWRVLDGLVAATMALLGLRLLLG
ncbi:LysE/ArgO family amino acid transporter [Solicola sp. PLA-1-18]|uniref:LysE/ArgO family amino acid transporter n=1 Tax=Solicola sp. PLA-1-18 TaxID=3380532 RepID=UPI003B794FF7